MTMENLVNNNEKIINTDGAFLKALECATKILNMRQILDAGPEGHKFVDVLKELGMNDIVFSTSQDENEKNEFDKRVIASKLNKREVRESIKHVLGRELDSTIMGTNVWGQSFAGAVKTGNAGEYAEKRLQFAYKVKDAIDEVEKLA